MQRRPRRQHAEVVNPACPPFLHPRALLAFTTHPPDQAEERHALHYFRYPDHPPNPCLAVHRHLAAARLENRRRISEDSEICDDCRAPHQQLGFSITLGVCFALRAKIYWMGKASLFAGPLGPIMRWLGGIAVDRSKSNNLVQQMIDVFNNSDELCVTIPPEGTRSKVQQWKTGFYHIAQGAQVPIMLAYMDYQRKVAGFGPLFYPTGDLEKDLAEIQAYYKDVVGKNPDAQ